MRAICAVCKKDREINWSFGPKGQYYTCGEHSPSGQDFSREYFEWLESWIEKSMIAERALDRAWEKNHGSG